MQLILWHVFKDSPASPVHTGVCSVVVEGSLRARAALLTLLPAALQGREGGALSLAGGHTAAVLHGGGTADGCRGRPASP